MSDRSEGYWDRVARWVTTHPGKVLLASAVLLIPPLFALSSLRGSHNTLEELPGGARSVQGFELLESHFPPGEISPVIVIVDAERSVLEEPSFRALADLSKNLKRLPEVASVRSVAMPTNGETPDLSADPRSQQLADQAAALPDRLNQAANGASRIEDGLAQAIDGVNEIATRLPELHDGLGRAQAGAGELLDGVTRIRDGVGRLRGGLGELRGGLVEARDGVARLHDDVAVPSDERIRDAWDVLFDQFTVGRTDPRYQDALEAVGEVYGRVTGEDPRTGEQVDSSYEGLPEALARLGSGLGEAIGGVDRLDDGVVQLDDGLARVADGLRELRDGLGDAEAGVARLQDGIAQLLDGLERLHDGADQLATGLQQGATRIEQFDLGSLLPGEGGGPFTLTVGMLDAVPDLRDQLGFFLADGDRRTRIFIGLEHSPFARESLLAVDRIQRTVELSLSGSPLAEADVYPTGVPAFFDNLDEAADRDFRLILVAVIVGVFLVLVLLLRALVAPLYMVATVLLSFGSALGVTVIVYQGLLDQPLAWWIPPFLYVLLVALGADYNIYLMSRVREEAENRTTLRAVAEGTRATGHVITSAGLILAGTFAALIAAPMSSLAQLGFATTFGILLDTFVVRSFVVPSIAALLGRHNWWPSARAHAD